MRGVSSSFQVNISCHKANNHVTFDLGTFGSFALGASLLFVHARTRIEVVTVRMNSRMRGNVALARPAHSLTDDSEGRRNAALRHPFPRRITALAVTPCNLPRSRRKKGGVKGSVPFIGDSNNAPLLKNQDPEQNRSTICSCSSVALVPAGLSKIVPICFAPTGSVSSMVRLLHELPHGMACPLDQPPILCVSFSFESRQVFG